MTYHFVFDVAPCCAELREGTMKIPGEWIDVVTLGVDLLSHEQVPDVSRW